MHDSTKNNGLKAYDKIVEPGASFSNLFLQHSAYPSLQQIHQLEFLVPCSYHRSFVQYHRADKKINFKIYAKTHQGRSKFRVR